MTLKKRLIPCLDVTGGRVVKGTNFIGLRDAGDPVELAKFYDREGADELVFLDITASSDAREILLHIVERTAEQVFIPFTVGGGIRDTDTMRALLKAGADKISLNTAAVSNPDLIRQGAEMFGAQCIVLAVDARQTAPGKWEVYTHGGRTPTGLDAVDWIKRGRSLGAGEILLTSMDRDGTKKGYDCALLQAAAAAVDLPIIASGGAGNMEHIGEALRHCSAALLASLLHYKELSIVQIKHYLQAQNIPVR
ncbi:imidazole glycerol phosphate synthase HisF [Candidatus Termititenax persephonae]|uniref:Imidazole glycerol phosphate synthase subunit HisF n=1 Tax=Candidatus Termititenax persephonae TaxID=2218525 RepID=A0A388TGV9_9BACT|nr:imidazole glycerol phosphate synthase HisF [Candidatus Termititenax persephonae]